MVVPRFRRIPAHLGVIPDGNRRWAESRQMTKERGYAYGVDPGLELCALCRELGIREVTFYGFTQDNTKRPAVQREAFQRACVTAVQSLGDRQTDVLVVGNTGSGMFPPELGPYTEQRERSHARLKINLLVNYSWQWDFAQAFAAANRDAADKTPLVERIGSAAIPRIDLIVRWGGRRRLSGFLPIQTVYADFFIVEQMWPDFARQHLLDALAWYQEQDPTLGG
jgi:undecaprenyl diphosphate synthase